MIANRLTNIIKKRLDRFTFVHVIVCHWYVNMIVADNSFTILCEIVNCI